MTMSGRRCSHITLSVGPYFFRHVPQWPCPVRTGSIMTVKDGGNCEVALSEVWQSTKALVAPTCFYRPHFFYRHHSAKAPKAILIHRLRQRYKL